MCFNESESAVLNFWIALCPFFKIIKVVFNAPKQAKGTGQSQNFLLCILRYCIPLSKEEGIDPFHVNELFYKGTCNKVKMLRVRMVNCIY